MRQIGMLRLAQVMVNFPVATCRLLLLWWNSRLGCHMVVHGYEETTEYEKLLDEGRFHIPLSYHIENYVSGSFHGIDKMFSYHQSGDVCTGKRFTRI
jgi:hypothetical protein